MNSPSSRLRVAILISGRGSNMQALIEDCAQAGSPAEIALVISNKADAGGLALARAAGISTEVVSHRAYADRTAFEAEIGAKLRAAGIQLVCLAGFMRILSDEFVAAWLDRMINIHPSLLPSFRGLDTHARALAAGVRLHGCTVHFVRPEMDTGPMILQAAVPGAATDTQDSLAARVLSAEQRIYPLALRWIAEGRVRVENERAIVDGAAAATDLLINPRA
jgi:phosphoribosylglycinamide formyltransferase-1